jgi:cytochrome c2
MKALNRLAITTLAGVLVLAPPAIAQNAKAGYIVAQRRCNVCHEIDRGRIRDDVSPSFATIARRPSTTITSLDMLLSTPHHRMPGNLMRQEIADVSAYILSLK